MLTVCWYGGEHDLEHVLLDLSTQPCGEYYTIYTFVYLFLFNQGLLL